MASGLCAALTGRTHGRTDQPANVKKTLANSEPSTHGTSRHFAATHHFGRFRGGADMDRTWVGHPLVADDPLRKWSVHRSSRECLPDQLLDHLVGELLEMQWHRVQHAAA